MQMKKLRPGRLNIPPSPQGVPDFLGLFLDNTAPGPRSSLDFWSNFSVRVPVEMIIDSWASNAPSFRLYSTIF